MIDYQYGNNKELDKKILAEKAEKPMELSSGGDVDKVEYTHEDVGEELLTLFAMTKLSTSERAIVACRLKGMHIEDALLYCQRHKLCIGMRIPEAVAIENYVKAKMVGQLQKMEYKDIRGKFKRGDAAA